MNLNTEAKKQDTGERTTRIWVPYDTAECGDVELISVQARVRKQSWLLT